MFSTLTDALINYHIKRKNGRSLRVYGVQPTCTKTKRVTTVRAIVLREVFTYRGEEQCVFDATHRRSMFGRKLSIAIDSHVSENNV